MFIIAASSLQFFRKQHTLNAILRHSNLYSVIITSEVPPATKKKPDDWHGVFRSKLGSFPLPCFSLPFPWFSEQFRNLTLQCLCNQRSDQAFLTFGKKKQTKKQTADRRQKFIRRTVVELFWWSQLILIETTFVRMRANWKTLKIWKFGQDKGRSIYRYQAFCTSTLFVFWSNFKFPFSLKVGRWIRTLDWNPTQHPLSACPAQLRSSSRLADMFYFRIFFRFLVCFVVVFLPSKEQSSVLCFDISLSNYNVLIIRLSLSEW